MTTFKIQILDKQDNHLSEISVDAYNSVNARSRFENIISGTSFVLYGEVYC